MPSSGAGADATPAIHLEETGLRLGFATGEVYFNAYWLRDADPTTIDPATRERIFDITEIAGGPRPTSAHIEVGELIIHWAQEAHVTRLPLSMLADFAATGRTPDPAALPRRLWYADGYHQFQRFDQGEIARHDLIRCQFARALIEDGVALVTGMEDSDAALAALAGQLGGVTPTSDGHFFDVQMEIAPTNLAFTARALEMHTDLPSEEAAPGVQFLHCRANSVLGGNNLFLDGTAVAEALRAEDPGAFELLAHHEVPFFRRHDGWDYRARQRVIELDENGEVSGLTVSQHLQDIMDLPQRLLDSYYPAFCRLIRMMKEPRFVARFRLEAGQCIVFDNHRIVHGREAFEATSGRRHLRGCYVDRGALRSTYRTLMRTPANVPVAG